MVLQSDLLRRLVLIRWFYPQKGSRDNSISEILAIGDDATDETLFRALPESAVSIRVGVTGTHAQHNLRNVAEVADLLHSLAETSGGSLKSAL